MDITGQREKTEIEKGNGEVRDFQYNKIEYNS